MKFKVKITEEVVNKTIMCGTPECKGMPAKNCLFAYCYNQLIPNVHVEYKKAYFIDENDIKIASAPLDSKIISAIIEFDNMRFKDLNKRREFIGKEYEFDIPDSVIEFYYGDTVKAIQHLIDNPVLTPIL